MSYLSSILGSINNPNPSRSATGSPANAAPISRPPPIVSNNAHISKVTTTTNTIGPSSSSPSLKRKSDDIASSGRTEKGPRENTPQQRPESRPSQAQTPSYGGTARPGAPQVNITRPAQVAAVRAPPPAAAVISKPAASGPPPSKGSYKDILARAAANQKAQANFGKVTHKPVEKLSRRERLKREEEAAAAAKKLARSSATTNGRHQVSGPSGGIGKSGNAGRVVGGPKSAVAAVEKPRRQPVDLGYKGTMRAQPSSSKSRPAAKQRPANSRPYGGDRYTYAGSDSGSEVASYDEDDDRDGMDRDDDEGEDDEDDDDDDDAGGGFDELMEEEEASLRAARKEDAEALRQETEHRRDKERRRAALAALAAKRAK